MTRRNVPLTKLQERVLRSILKAHGAACISVRRPKKRRLTAKHRRAILANLRKARKARWK